MAKFGKPPKKSSRFGLPPELNESSSTLEAPEHAPALTINTTSKKARKKTGRTVQFATKVTADFDEEFREIAFRSKLKHSELLEKMLDEYKKIKR